MKFTKSTRIISIFLALILAFTMIPIELVYAQANVIIGDKHSTYLGLYGLFGGEKIAYSTLLGKKPLQTGFKMFAGGDHVYFEFVTEKSSSAKIYAQKVYENDPIENPAFLENNTYIDLLDKVELEPKIYLLTGGIYKKHLSEYGNTFADSGLSGKALYDDIASMEDLTTPLENVRVLPKSGDLCNIKNRMATIQASPSPSIVSTPSATVLPSFAVSESPNTENIQLENQGVSPSPSAIPSNNITEQPNETVENTNTQQDGLIKTEENKVLLAMAQNKVKLDTQTIENTPQPSEQNETVSPSPTQQPQPTIQPTVAPSAIPQESPSVTPTETPNTDLNPSPSALPSPSVLPETEQMLMGIKPRVGAYSVRNIIHWAGTYQEGYDDVAFLPEGRYIITVEFDDGEKMQLPVIVADYTENKTRLAYIENLENVRKFKTSPCVTAGDPVDMLNGNFTWEYSDITMHGDVPLEFTRKYNSLVAAENTFGLGNGWSSNYNYKLYDFEQGIYVTMPYGTVASFERHSNGMITAEKGSAYSLSYANGQYILTESAGETVVFNAIGLPTEIYDINKNQTILENDGKKITAVSNKTGKLTLDYTGELLTAVTDSTGRRIEYAYQDTDLSGAKNPDGDSFAYTYTNHNLATVTDFNSQVILQNVYDDKRRVISQMQPDRGTQRFSYDDENRVNTFTDALGNISSITYNKDKLIIADTNASGTISYTFDEANRKLTETDRAGNITSYVYENRFNGNTGFEEYTTNVLEKTYPDLTKESFTYNEKNQITTKTQRDGTTIAFGYDAKGNLISQTMPNGAVVSLGYDNQNNLISKTDALGNVQSYTYDSNGNMLTHTDAMGNTTRYEYDTVGRLVKETSPMGKATRYEYSTAGKLVKEINAGGKEKTFTYTGNGFELTQTDYRQNTQATEYSVLNDPISVTDKMGNQTVNTYDYQGNLISQADATGAKTVYGYDSIGRLISITDANGNVSSLSYDANGNITTQSKSLGANTTNVYDVNNRLTSQTNSRGTATSYEYDLMGRITVQKDANGGVVRFSYDANGNLISKTDANGNKTVYSYDAENKLIETVSPLGAKTVFNYDKQGNLISTQNANGASQSAGLDNDGNVITSINNMGVITSYEYDNLNRVVRKQNADNTFITYVYDENGNIISQTDENGNKTTLEYDKNDRLTVQINALGEKTQIEYTKNGLISCVINASGNKTSYIYDNNKNLISETDMRGNAQSFTYDALNRVTTVTDEQGNVTAYSYDTQGNQTAITKPTGGTIQNSYDNLDRVIKTQDALNNSQSYTYDLNGNRTSVTNRRGYTTCFAYDAENRLTKVTDALGGVTAYSYDNLGKIITVTYADNTETKTEYNANQNPVSVKGELDTSTNYEYDSMGRVTTETLSNGEKTSYQYDKKGNLIKTIDAMGGETVYEYDALNRIVSETNANNAKTAYTYTTEGNVKTVTDALKGVVKYTYDQNGNILTETDQNGNTVAFSYDKNNRVLSETDKNGNIFEISYDKNDNAISVKNPDSGIENIEYNLNDLPVLKTDAEGYKTIYAYDANGNLTVVTDPRGNSTKYDYDKLDRQTSVTTANGKIVTAVYDNMGRVMSVTNGDGAVTGYEYDALGRTVKITNALGGFKAYSYDNMGNVTTETDENGVVRSFEYDALNRVVSYTDGLGYKESYDYDKLGNLTSKTDKKGNVESFTYDKLNRVVSQTDALGNTKYFGYDMQGNITKVTDKNGNTTQYVLDGNGNIVKQLDSLGHVSYFSYDSMNRLIKVRLYSGEENEKNEQITLYSFDKRGLVTKEINAQGGEKTYTYDESGNLVQTKDQDGFVTSYQNNEVNLVSSIRYANGKQVKYLYNAQGELIEFADWNGVTTLERDALDRLVRVKDHNNRFTGYEWDNVGNLTALIYPDKTTAKYEYDAENMQTKATDANGGVYRFSYDANGNINKKEYPNRELEYYAYDANNQKIRTDEYAINGTQKTYTAYTYDANGNRTSDCNRVPTTPNTSWSYRQNTGTWGGGYNQYSYDELNRLTKEYEVDTAQTKTYTYDSLGNRLSQKDNKGTTTFKYNELNQLIEKSISTGKMLYEYDGRGNRVLETPVSLQENRRTYEWDESGKLVRGTRGTDWNYYQSEYTYNGIGLRINSTIVGPEKTIYDRDYIIDYTSNENNDIMEYNVGVYQWQGTKKVHTLKYTYTQNSERLAVNAKIHSQWGGADTEYTLNIHEDIMGSATAYTYQGGWNNGQWANKHEYDVWGFNTKAPTYNYDPMYRATEPYYTGHPYDGSLNIYFAENRFYDAETGTWLSQDPIKDGLNWYVYCEGNPTTFVDVLGLDAMVVNGNLIEDIVQNSDGSYSYNADELARLVTNPNFTNNSLTTLERAMLYDSLKNTQSEYVKRDYFGKMMCQTFDSQRYIEWYDVAANVNVPQNSKWGKAVLLMDNYLKKDKSLFEGMSIFFFEGLGDYSGGRNRFHPEGQYGAMSIVIDNGKITFVTQEASTLPDQYVANTRNCVVDPGIYSLNYVRHAGLIHGFNVVGNNNDKVLVKTFSVNNAQGYHIEQCAAINVHSVAIPFNDNSNNSEGCITLSKTEYVKFGFYTGLFDNEVFDIYVNFKSEYLYSDIKKFSSEDENTMQQLLQDVQLIVNREHMLKSAMLFSSKHSN